MPSNPVMRPIREEDTPQLSYLMRATFGPRRAGEDVWRHKYFGAPWAGFPGLVALDGDEIVAVSGRMWRPLSLDGRVSRSVQGCDLIVLPRYRGTGLRQRLSIEADRLAREDGGTLLYTYPNGMSADSRGDKRRYWGAHASFRGPSFVLRYYVKVLRPAGARGVAQRFRPGLAGPLGLALAALARAPALPVRERGLDVRAVPAAPDDVGDLAARLLASARFQTVRDRAYLRWRYEQNPASRYQFVEARRGGDLAGLMVFAEDEVGGTPGVLVMDWLVDPASPRVFDAMLRSVVASARRLESAAFVALAAGRPYARSAMGQGFWPVPDRLVTYRMRFTPRRPGPEAVDFLELARGRNWFMTIGDSDVF